MAKKKSVKTVKGTKKTAKKAPKKAAKKAPRKASKLKSISQTHGKEENLQPTTLDQVWGDKGDGKYSTSCAATYESEIREMNLTDLQMHSTQIGLIPIQNREVLTKRLLKEFQKHWNSYQLSPVVKNKTLGNLPQSVRDTLAEGR